jgi:hypothetical protein
MTTVPYSHKATKVRCSIFVLITRKSKVEIITTVFLLALVLRTPFTPETNAYTSSTPDQTRSFEKIAAEAADDSDCGYLG